MTPAKTVARLRTLADDWRREEERLCAQFGSEVVPQSLRARMIKDAKAIDAAITLIERTESDLATAEQDSRQKQARIERLEGALRLIADTDPVDAALDPQRAVRVARDALEESK